MKKYTVEGFAVVQIRAKTIDKTEGSATDSLNIIAGENPIFDIIDKTKIIVNGHIPDLEIAMIRDVVFTNVIEIVEAQNERK